MSGLVATVRDETNVMKPIVTRPTCVDFYLKANKSTRVGTYDRGAKNLDSHTERLPFIPLWNLKLGVQTMQLDDFFYRSWFYRGEADCLRGKSAPMGKFGRMFPELRPLVPDPKKLKQLGEKMVDIIPDRPEGDNSQVPAGYTYLGQFVDHDITFDITPLQNTLVDPMAIQNFRSPALDLDSLYGAGPAVQPYLYEPTFGSQEKFLIGTTVPAPTGRSGEIIPAKPNDLPRAIQNALPQNSPALIGDPRNDENLIVAQMHVAFLKFHNQIVEGLKAGTIPRQSPMSRTRFEEARELVIWH